MTPKTVVNAGIVIRQNDAVAQSKAAKCGLGLKVATDWTLPWEHTLFIAPGTCVPWDLVCTGMDFIRQWDIAAPFWRAFMLAKSLGTPADRQRTEKAIHDLRVPVYSHELLFVRASEAGKAFLSTWRQECQDGGQDGGQGGGDERLAFLRALYAVKPLFCVLPRLWLADIAQRETSDRLARQRRPPQAEPLVKVEIAPGRFVLCHERDKATVLERFANLQGGRRHGRR